MTARTARIHCLICPYEFDAATPADPPADALPYTGAVSLCLNCGNLAIFTGPQYDVVTGVRPVTRTELTEILTDPAVLRYVAWIRARGPLR